jgi:hypothetical protein
MSTSDQLFAQLMILLVVLIMVVPVIISDWRKAQRTPPSITPSSPKDHVISERVARGGGSRPPSGSLNSGELMMKLSSRTSDELKNHRMGKEKGTIIGRGIAMKLFVALSQEVSDITKDQNSQ